MSYTIKCDTHTHTLFSKHAYSTIEENVRAAAEAGMELLFSARRLDYSGIEEMEDELDDNYLWVTKCKK